MEQLLNEGWAGPFPLLGTQDECDAIVAEAQRVGKSTRVTKGLHGGSSVLRRLAGRPEIRKLIEPILGTNFQLWGCQLITSGPGHVHRTHIDIEFAAIKGVTVWIGLKNLSEKTTLKIISHTDELPRAPQQIDTSKLPQATHDYIILEAAQELDSRCTLNRINARSGEFVIWRGRTWHGTENLSLETRNSLILQYCSADEIPHIPESYDFPVKVSKNKFIGIPVAGLR